MTPIPPTVDAPVPRRPLTLRGGLRRLSTGLIAYGLIGVLVAVLGSIALLWISGRVGGIADRTGLQVASIITTLDSTAEVLESAGGSATSFSGTLERTPPAVRQTAATLRNLRENLLEVEGQLGAINILGSRPLSNAADLFGQMADDLEGLDGRLDTIATDLEANRGALIDNARALEQLGGGLDAVAQDLRRGVVQESLADVQAIVIVLSVLALAWTLLPAVAALGLGLWIRRELGDVDRDGVIAV